MPLLFILLLLIFPLAADELTVDPPRIWDVDCIRCRPAEIFDPLCEIEDNVVVDLLNPIYENGILTTHEGGTLVAPEFRVQSETIIYTRNLNGETPIFNVFCEGKVLIDYKEWILTGDCLYYDFLTHTGYIINGRTANAPWYVGGKEILLLEDGDLVVLDGYLTTSESDPRDVIIWMPRINLSSNRVIRASNITLRIRKVPLLWVPTFKYDLNNTGRSPFAVKFGWGGFMGSHLSLLYKFLSWGDFQGIARIDGFFTQGVGGGIETCYNPNDSPAQFYTRNYYASDIALDDPIRRHRYRFQGTFYDRFGNLVIDGMYDAVSDGQMAAEYQTKDFELYTAGRTQVELRQRENAWIANLFTRVRVNNFQSVNQELPSFQLNWHPFEIPATGIMVENTLKASYLHYIFTKEVDCKGFHSGRLAINPLIYRPFFLGPVTATPEAGFIGIAYSNTPSGSSAGQAIGKIGFKTETAFSKNFGSWKHIVEPYAHYHYLTNPRVSNKDHFIFTIQDGYHYFNMLRFGVRNSIFKKTESGILRNLWVDLWANAFFNTTTIPQVVQKGYLLFDWVPYCRLFVEVEGCWNFEHNQVDYYNPRVLWTQNENLAFGLEFRHRGLYDWRKADQYNFILDATRTEEQLLDSPLSQHRNTLLFRTFARITPDWNLKFDMRHGWNRYRLVKGQKESERPYFEFQVELGTVIFQHWRTTFIYENRESDNRFSFSLKLDKGAPPKRKACL